MPNGKHTSLPKLSVISRTICTRAIYENDQQPNISKNDQQPKKIAQILLMVHRIAPYRYNFDQEEIADTT